MTTDEQVVSASPPVFATRFVGRQAEIASLRQLLEGSRRLLTLVGVGGAGKTRLAAELSSGLIEAPAGSSRRDGVVWADLSAVHEPEDVAPTVAEAVGLRDTADLDPGSVLGRTLVDSRLLLVLDNAENVAVPCRELIDDLLAGCPSLVVVATSRVPLRSPNEHLVRVPPMGVDPADGQRSEAAELFYDRAGQALPRYPHLADDIDDVNAVCRRVDGIPLAIELAAPWIRTLSARDLLVEINRSADVLASRDPHFSGQHRSMRAVLDSTWRRMSESSRATMRSLAVLVGGFSGEAAERVADTSAAVLESLADQSLIFELRDHVEGVRYGMHELVRSYAAEMLDLQGPDEVERVRARHLDYFLDLSERAHADRDPANELRWMLEIRSQQANAAAALRWAHDNDRAEEALRMTAALCNFWGGLSAAGRYQGELEAALALPWDPDSANQARARVAVLGAAGWAAMSHRDWAPAQRYFEEAAALYRQLGNEMLYALGLSNVGNAVVRGPDPTSGPRYLRQALTICQRLADPWGIATATYWLGDALFAAGQDAEAERLVLDALRQLTGLSDYYGEYCANVTLGHAYRRQARWSEAIESYLGALDAQQRFSYRTHGADILASLGVVGLALDRPDCAARLFGACRTWGETHTDMSILDAGLHLDRPKAAAKSRLVDGDWALQYATGRRLSTEQAMTMAQSDAQALLLASRGPLPHGLSAREMDVVSLVAEGLTDAAIAERLVLSPRTVQGHLRSVFGKLEVKNRSAAVHRATELGLLKSSEPARQ